MIVTVLSTLSQLLSLHKGKLVAEGSEIPRDSWNQCMLLSHLFSPGYLFFLRRFP